MVNGWTVTYTKSGQDIPIYNYGLISFEKILNDIGNFQISISNPTAQQIADITDDTEIKINAWDDQFYGYIKNPKYSSVNNTLTLGGSDYVVLLQNPCIDSAIVTHEDTTLSSGLRVVYNSVAFNTIVADLLTNTGVSAGTITNFGTYSTIFQNRKVYDGIKSMAEYAKYDWEVTTGKVLNMQSRLGSNTSVKTFDTSYNCTLPTYETDSQTGKIYRIIVLGKGSGSSQATGTWTAVDYDATNVLKNKTRVFVDPAIANNTQAAQVASNLGSFLNSTFLSATVAPSTYQNGLRTGDAITVVDPMKGSSTMRIMKIRRKLVASSDEILYDVVDNTSQMRKAEIEDILKKNQGLSEAIGTSAIGNIKTFKIDLTDNCDSGSPAIKKFTLPSEISSTADLLSAVLTLDRTSLLYDVPATTGNSVTNASITNASALTNSTITNASQGASESGYYFGVYSSSMTGDATWRSVGTSINTGGTVFFHHAIWANIRIDVAAVATSWAQNLYLRVYNSTDGTYYPDSNGIQLNTGFEVDGGQTVVFSAYILIPYKWTNKTYVVQYYVANETHWFGIGGEIYYAYMGTAAHTHSNTYNDTTHTNNNAFNDANHSNSITPDPNNPGGEGSLTLVAQINGTTVNSESGGTTFHHAGIDVLSNIQAGGIGLQTLTLYPSTGRARLSAELLITYLVES